jgi:polyisoprenyl-teichoic acid--peptidoglycan teichoic acid transferase
VVKQVERKEKPGKPQNTDLKNQSAPQASEESIGEAGSQRSAGTAGSIPSQLYNRLGLKMPRWLFWILSISIGMVLSGLFVSTLALWTPLWSTINRSDEELQWSGKDADKMPLPGDLWSDISQYKLTRPMNILVMGIEPVPNSVDGSPESFSGKSDTMLLIRLPKTQ